MTHLTRRDILKGAAGLALAPKFRQDEKKIVKSGRLKQSVCRWCYGKIPLPDFAKAVSEMGLGAIDLLTEAEWAEIKKFGLVCSMGYPDKPRRKDFIATGFNNRANHDMLVKELTDTIPKAADMGVPNVIAMFGNRVTGIDDKQAIENCVEGLNKVKETAEKHKVTVCVELLNSLVNHKGYQGDRTWFGVDVIKGVGSPYVKLLYDIYHMQIMEGNVIATVRANKDHIAHFHTGGVPGRHELDDTQELNWRSVAKAIADTGFKGYVAHEFIPTRDPLTSLREAVALCDV